MKEAKKIKDNQLEKVSGGRIVRVAAPVHKTTFWEKLKNFFGHADDPIDGEFKTVTCPKCGKVYTTNFSHPVHHYCTGAWETRTCPKCGEVYKCNPSLPPEFSNMNHHCSKKSSGEK